MRNLTNFLRNVN